MIQFTPWPAIVTYVDQDGGIAGSESYCFLKIGLPFKDDKAIHAHEYEHIRQFWMPVVYWLLLAAAYTAGAVYIGNVVAQHLAIIWIACGIFGFLSHEFLKGISDDYKCWTEVKAYRKQRDAYPPGTDVSFMAEFLATRYGLHMTVDEANMKLWGKP